ncbi:MAG TPA: Na/Pi symporter, partial [Steroidobacteraceae bacterium]|nr:Na/Pi symporter [Steroidobacteraceae bacterium]
MSVALNLVGGIALFLLAMLMLTEGLKVFAGSQLRQLLAGWTSTPLRGVFTGVLVTAAVQSSSAVTISTIGFVNAGVLTLRQALGVIFGANVGTTITGWLVSLVGFGWKIESLALPLLAAGVALRLLASRRRLQGLGEALAGFGLFFLALSFLTDAFASVATNWQTGMLQAGAGGVATFLMVGIIATVLTQSSSAAMALILSAAGGGVIAMDSAAAAVIGANIGTTSTAAVAVLRATAAARRLALGHIAFNLLTGAVALLLLPVMLAVVAWLGERLDIEQGAAPLLALFHTTFNVLGVLLMLPLAGHLATWLERRFRSAEEELARPQHLDLTLASTPALAAGALAAELGRLQTAVGELLRTTLKGNAGSVPAVLERQTVAIRSLATAISAYTANVQTGAMSAEVAQELARVLRITRHLSEAARLAPEGLPLFNAGVSDAGPVPAAIQSFLHEA